jgi:hypothetical protein
MNKLKTLKDIAGMSDINGNWIHLVHLRQEAIRWIKQIKTPLNEDNWKEFFNIEEEDLK